MGDGQKMEEKRLHLCIRPTAHPVQSGRGGAGLEPRTQAKYKITTLCSWRSSKKMEPHGIFIIIGQLQTKVPITYSLLCSTKNNPNDPLCLSLSFRWKRDEMKTRHVGSRCFRDICPVDIRAGTGRDLNTPALVLLLQISTFHCPAKAKAALEKHRGQFREVWLFKTNHLRMSV